ncbi:Protein npg1 [Stylosanthes scabra]|uniref:Protein npg1 n=1 Tax=Stylosanthes scabra TaxID=79078 RepID=A0ABU6YT68_9FABA|nr:Protein npg1 [Stylosanthes scabra]
MGWLNWAIESKWKEPVAFGSSCWSINEVMSKGLFVCLMGLIFKQQYSDCNLSFLINHPGKEVAHLSHATSKCKRVLDAVEKMFSQGISNAQVDNKLQEIVSHVVELLAELWKQAGYYPKAISAYKNALFSQWNLDNDCCARIQKVFAMFLLNTGVEANPPSLAVQTKGSYVPKNKLEEAILLLVILVRKLSW